MKRLIFLLFVYIIALSSCEKDDSDNCNCLENPEYQYTGALQVTFHNPIDPGYCHVQIYSFENINNYIIDGQPNNSTGIYTVDLLPGNYSAFVYDSLIPYHTHLLEVETFQIINGDTTRFEY